MSASTDPSARVAGRRLFIYGIIGLVVAVLILGTGAFVWLSQGGTASLVGGPFTLQDGNGRQVTDRDFRGKYMLVYFGYTFCPDVCPTTLNEVADALDHLGAQGRPAAADLHHGRSEARHAGGGEAVCRRLQPAADWPDRHSGSRSPRWRRSIASITPSIAPVRDRTTTRWITARCCT